LNVLIQTVPDELSDEFMKNLFDRSDLVGILKTLANRKETLESVQKQLYILQVNLVNKRHKERLVIYDKNNEEHEKLLMRFWNAVCPNTKLESRVSEQWKTIGFQGTDPATDFRGMGVLGLKHLIYFAETYPDTFRAIVDRQKVKALSEIGSDYPVAVGGINLTFMLFDIFNAGKQIADEGAAHASQSHPILFDHKNAFEELYCIALILLDKVWNTTGATYMQFQQVLATTREQFNLGLDTSNNLRAFCTIVDIDHQPPVAVDIVDSVPNLAAPDKVASKGNPMTPVLLKKYLMAKSDLNFLEITFITLEKPIKNEATEILEYPPWYNDPVWKEMAELLLNVMLHINLELRENASSMLRPTKNLPDRPKSSFPISKNFQPPRKDLRSAPPVINQEKLLASVQEETGDTVLEDSSPQ